MSKAPIEFYFDFSSPYGYLAATQIEALAERVGRSTIWRPFMLGAAFKSTGQSPLIGQPLRGPYALHDLARAARRLGVPFAMPAPFPFLALAPSRAFYWIDAQDPGLAKRFARAVYDAAFGEGRAPADLQSTLALAERLGIETAALGQALVEAKLKEKLRLETEQAIARGAFGSPFFFVGAEPFWGHDRLDQLEEWVRGGGW